MTKISFRCVLLHLFFIDKSFVLPFPDKSKLVYVTPICSVFLSLGSLNLMPVWYFLIYRGCWSGSVFLIDGFRFEWFSNSMAFLWVEAALFFSLLYCFFLVCTSLSRAVSFLLLYSFLYIVKSKVPFLERSSNYVQVDL